MLNRDLIQAIKDTRGNCDVYVDICGTGLHTIVSKKQLIATLSAWYTQGQETGLKLSRHGNDETVYAYKIERETI